MPVCLLCCHSVRPSVRPVPVELAPPVVPLARSKSAPAGAALHSKASPSTPLEAQARVVQLGRQLSDDGQAHASGGLSPRTPSTDAAGGVASIWKAVQRMNSAGGDADVGQGADGPAWLPVGASSQPVDAALQRKLQLEQDVHITIGFLCDAAHAVSVDTIHARAAAKRQAKKDRQREAAEGVAGSASDGAQAASAAAEGAGAATGAGAGVGAGAGAGATAGAAAGAGGAGLESATPAAAGTTTTTTVAVALIKSLQARKARAHQRLEALQLATNKVAHILLHEGETPASVAKKHVSTEDSLPMLSVPDVLLCTELINGVAEGLCSPKIGKNMGGYLTGLEVRVGWGLGGLPQVQQCMTDPWRGFHCAGLRLGAGDAVAVHSARLLGHHGTPASLHCPARVAVRCCAHVDAAVGIARRLPVCRAAASASAAPALRVNAAGGSWKRRRSGACRAGRPPSHFRDCHHVRLRLCCCMRRILACRTRARAYALCDGFPGVQRVAAVPVPGVAAQRGFRWGAECVLQRQVLGSGSRIRWCAIWCGRGCRRQRRVHRRGQRCERLRRRDDGEERCCEWHGAVAASRIPAGAGRTGRSRQSHGCPCRRSSQCRGAGWQRCSRWRCCSHHRRGVCHGRRCIGAV